MLNHPLFSSTTLEVINAELSLTKSSLNWWTLSPFEHICKCACDTNLPRWLNFTKATHTRAAFCWSTAPLGTSLSLSLSLFVCLMAIAVISIVIPWAPMDHCSLVFNHLLYLLYSLILFNSSVFVSLLIILCGLSSSKSPQWIRVEIEWHHLAMPQPAQSAPGSTHFAYIWYNFFVSAILSYLEFSFVSLV